MRDEIQHIIERMSPIELCMLQDRGVQLPHHLAARAEEHRRGSDLIGEWTPRQEAKRFGQVANLRSVA